MHPLDNNIDKNIFPYVSVLRQRGFNTYVSCQGAMPDRDSEHAFWCHTIGILPFTGKDYTYIDNSDNAEVYKEYLRLIEFVSVTGWNCYVSFKMTHPNNDDGKFLPLLELQWMVPLDWGDVTKYPADTEIQGDWTGPGAIEP